MEDISIDGRIILKGTRRRVDGGVWTCFVSHGIGTSLVINLFSSMKCRELKLRKMMVFLGFKLLSKGLFWHFGGTSCLFFEGDYLAQVDAEVIGRKEV